MRLTTKQKTKNRRIRTKQQHAAESKSRTTMSRITMLVPSCWSSWVFARKNNYDSTRAYCVIILLLLYRHCHRSLRRLRRSRSADDPEPTVWIRRVFGAVKRAVRAGRDPTDPRDADRDRATELGVVVQEYDRHRE